MQWFPDILSTFQSLGIFATITFMLLFFIGKWASNRVNAICSLVEKTAQNINLLTDSQKDPYTGELIRRKHVMDKIESTGHETADDIGEFIKGHCGSSACPLVPVISKELVNMKEILTRFTDDGVKTRADTKATVDAIYSRINSFIESLGVEMISAMKTLAEVSKSQKRTEARDDRR